MSPEDQNKHTQEPLSTETPGSHDQAAPMPAPTEPQEAMPDLPEQALPGAGVEDDLDAEIEAALGDGSIMDLYDLDKPQPQAGGPKDQSGKGESEQSRKAASGVTRGKVISISGDDIFVDLGGKSQGLLPREELEGDESIEVGQEIDVAVVRYDARDGLVILSKKSATERLVWHDMDEGALVEARVTGHNKGGLEVTIKGVQGFMPASQIDIYRVEDFEPYVGQKLVCEVTQVDRGDKNVILSRRNVLERESEEKRTQLWEELEKGQTRHGVVRSLMDYGAFVDLGGVDGLLHVREMSWARVKHPKDILSEGQGIDVLVIGVDREKQRISLSLKQAGGDPWTVVEQKYFEGSHHTVTVTNLMDFGAFAELEPGVEGLIPISQMTWAGRVRHPSDVVQVGAIAEVEIMKVNVTDRKISMSMKKLQANPWEAITERYQPEQLCKGKVCRITDFGAFVTLEEGVDGLIHISELSDKRVAKVGDVVSEGQEVDVKVRSVDAKERRIALTMKGLSTDSESVDAASTTETADTQPSHSGSSKKKKKDRPRRGGLSW